MTENPIKHPTTVLITHKEASSDQPPHEPDLEGDLAVLQTLPIGEEQQQVGDHADEGGGQQDQAHQPSTLPSTAHGFTPLFLSLTAPCPLALLSLPVVSPSS